MNHGKSIPTWLQRFSLHSVFEGLFWLIHWEAKEPEHLTMEFFFPFEKWYLTMFALKLCALTRRRRTHLVCHEHAKLLSCPHNLSRTNMHTATSHTVLLNILLKCVKQRFNSGHHLHPPNPLTYFLSYRHMETHSSGGYIMSTHYGKTLSLWLLFFWLLSKRDFILPQAFILIQGV